MATADISLIVSTLGRREPLERLLGSLRRVSRPAREIIVVDQNAEGFLEPLLARYGDLPLVHLRCERGLSRARNRGLRHAHGSIVGFPDDDCWYPPEALSHVEAFFGGNPAVGVLTGLTTDATGAPSVSPHLDRSAAIGRTNVFLAGNSNGLFVRRELACGVGGFDEALGVGAASPFQSGEETDFVLRCLATGASGYFDRSLVLHHDQSDETGAQHLNRVRAYSAGFGRVLRMHRFGGLFVAQKLARASVGALICLARRDIGGATQRRAWIAGTLRGFTAPQRPPRQIASQK